MYQQTAWETTWRNHAWLFLLWCQPTCSGNQNWHENRKWVAFHILLTHYASMPLTVSFLEEPLRLFHHYLSEKNMERLSNTLFISRVIHGIGSYFVCEIIVLSNLSTNIISKLLKTIRVALVKWNVVFSYFCPTRYGITICPCILANFY